MVYETNYAVKRNKAIIPRHATLPFTNHTVWYIIHACTHTLSIMLGYSLS